MKIRIGDKDKSPETSDGAHSVSMRKGRPLNGGHGVSIDTLVVVGEFDHVGQPMALVDGHPAAMPGALRVRLDASNHGLVAVRRVDRLGKDPATWEAVYVGLIGR